MSNFHILINAVLSYILNKVIYLRKRKFVIAVLNLETSFSRIVTKSRAAQGGQNGGNWRDLVRPGPSAARTIQR